MTCLRLPRSPRTAAIFCLLATLTPASMAHAQDEAQGTSAPESETAPADNQGATDPANTEASAGSGGAVDSSVTASDESRVTSQVASFAPTRLKDSPAV